MDLKGFKKVGSTSTHTIFEHPEGHIIHVANKAVDGSKRNEMKKIPEKKMADGGVAKQMADATSGDPYQPTAQPGTPDPIDWQNVPVTEGTPTQPMGGAPQPQQLPLSEGRYQQDPNDPMSGLPGYEQEKAGELGIAGNAAEIAKQAKNAMGAAQAAQKMHDVTFNRTQAELQDDIADVTQDIANGHINPNDYMENQSVGSKIATAIGLALGGFGQSVSGHNPAMEFLHNQIERNLNAQKADLGRKENLLSSLQKQYGDNRIADDMFRVHSADDLARRVDMIAQTSKIANAPYNQQLIKSSLAKEYIPNFNNAVALRVAQKLSQQGGQGAPEGQEQAAAILSGILVPPAQQEQAAKDLDIAHKTLLAHQAADEIPDKVAALQTPWNRISNLFQSKQQIDAINERLVPLILDASPSKRLSPEVIRKEIEPYLVGLTTGKQTVEEFKKSLHSVIEAHADIPSTLMRARIPVPKYQGQQAPANIKTPEGDEFMFDPRSGGMRKRK